jgi:hypothetical protein
VNCVGLMYLYVEGLVLNCVPDVLDCVRFPFELCVPVVLV